MALDEHVPQESAALEGRRRLTGAFLINLDRIEPDPDQPRKHIDPTYLAELTNSVRNLGVLQPITVRYIEKVDRYRIIAGECRYTAATKADLKELPCWVKTPKAEHVLLEQIVENWQRSDLNAFDLADSLAILRDANGYTQKQLAKATGKGESEISRLLSILELEPEVQKLARNDQAGRITKRHLFAVARLHPQMQHQVLARVERDELTAIDTERIVSRIQQKSDRGRKAGAPVSRRRYSTKYGTVAFTFRKEHATDQDVLFALREVKQQIQENEAQHQVLDDPM